MKHCIMCGELTDGSTAGPYVCDWCDCGVRPDGRDFSEEDAIAYYRRLVEWRSAKDKDARFPSIFEERQP